MVKANRKEKIKYAYIQETKNKYDTLKIATGCIVLLLSLSSIYVSSTISSHIKLDTILNPAILFGYAFLIVLCIYIGGCMILFGLLDPKRITISKRVKLVLE